MPRSETGPNSFLYPVLGAFLGYMFGWTIAVILKDQPFEWIQGGFGTAGLAWGATQMPYCLVTWLVCAAGLFLGWKVHRLPPSIQ